MANPTSVKRSKSNSNLAQASNRLPSYNNRSHRLWRSIRKNWDLYLISLPVIIYFIIFAYLPMYGVQIAFKDYVPTLGIWDSPWVGLKHLEVFCNSFYFERLIKNTLCISLYSIVVGIPLPIILALLFEEIRSKKLRSVLQSVSYAPNFMSVVVVCGMILMFLNQQSGLIPAILKMFGVVPETSMIANPEAFWDIYVWSGVWQGVGWSSLMYTAAISGIPADQYEAAIMDGASKLRQVWSITLPNILPTIVIITIFSIGGLMGVGHEKIYLLQNAANMETSEVISTYVYKAGLTGMPRYSFASMVGLFNNIINIIILAITNFFAKKATGTGLW